MKHYAYYNMSRRTQLTTKYLFSVLAQLSENFIFIYLGLSLFTDDTLTWRPLFILITLVGICVARWIAVFPISSLINFVIRRRAAARGRAAPEEIPRSYQGMLFWAGLRGAVGVALAAGFMGETKHTLRATVLVVVVLTVILFGGTTARMLEILGIRTGVVDEIDSDDEFDIEAPNWKQQQRAANTFPGFGPGDNSVPLASVRGPGYASGQHSPNRPLSAMARRNTAPLINEEGHPARGLDSDEASDAESDAGLPPPAQKRSPQKTTPVNEGSGSGSGTGEITEQPAQGYGGYVNQLAGIWRTTTEDQAEWFKKLDEDFIKPTLLLDPKSASHGDYGGPSGS